MSTQTQTQAISDLDGSGARIVRVATRRQELDPSATLSFGLSPVRPYRRPNAVVPMATTATAATPDAVPALLSTSFARSITNQRQLRVRVRVPRRSTLTAMVTRDGRSLGHVELGPVAAGSRTITVPIQRGAIGGNAMLTLGITPLGGELMPLSKAVRLPARILS